jgi:hypothetical protein
MANKNTPPHQVETLNAVLMFLANMTLDANARVEALRVLLEERGAFSHDEFEQAHQKMLAILETQFSSTVAQSEEAATAAKLREVLEGHEGTKQ